MRKDLRVIKTEVTGWQMKTNKSCAVTDIRLKDKTCGKYKEVEK